MGLHVTYTYTYVTYVTIGTHVFISIIFGCKLLDLEILFRWETRDLPANQKIQ